MEQSNKRERSENANSTNSTAQRSGGAETFLAPVISMNQSLLEDSFKVAQEKEKEFQEMTEGFVIPESIPFLECLNVLTVLHHSIGLNQEILLGAIDIFYRYLAKCESAVSDDTTATRIVAACTLLAAKFWGPREDEIVIRKKIEEKSKVNTKDLVEAEKQILLAIDYRFNWWNGPYFISYYANLLKYAQESKEVLFAHLVLIAAHHSHKTHQTEHSLNAAASFAIATEISAYSGSRGLLKRKRANVKLFKSNKLLPSHSDEQFVRCKRKILKAMRRCKNNNTKIYKLLRNECRIDPVEVLEQLAKRQKL